MTKKKIKIENEEKKKQEKSATYKVGSKKSLSKEKNTKK